MTTKKKIRPSRTARADSPRYKTRQAAVSAPEETTEQSWIILALAIFVLIGVAFISAITYVLLLG